MTSINRELFRKIADQIDADPASHDQGSWEINRHRATCGTARCVAGWAVFLTHGPVLEWSGAKLSLGFVVGDYDKVERIPAEAMRLLGISESFASQLFYSENPHAVEAVNDLADGVPEDVVSDRMGYAVYGGPW